jgi:flagella basal body P-ring formation protein FlgA
MALASIILVAASAAVPALVPATAAEPVVAPAAVEGGTAPQVRPLVRLVLKAGVVARGPRLTLADVADCSGTAALCDETYGIDVGPSPEPGKAAALSPDKLTAMLEREWPHADVNVEGATGRGSAGSKRSVRVVAEAEALDEDELTQAFAAQLTDLVGEDQRLEVEIGRVKPAGNPRVRPGGCRFVFPELTSANVKSADWAVRHLNGTRTFRVLCLDPRAVDADVAGSVDFGSTASAVPSTPDEVTEAELEDELASGEAMPPAVDGDAFTATAVLTLRRLVPVAAKDLERDTVLRAEDVDEAWIDMGRGPKIVVDAAATVGRRLKRGLAAGEAFPVGALEVPLAVRRGQVVSLKVVKGGLTVYGKAQLLANGAYGQVIDATSPTTKKRFRVRVVDATTVDYVH